MARRAGRFTIGVGGFGKGSWLESVAASFAPLMVDATSTPARSSKAAAAKVEIVIGDMVIRTAVDVEQGPEVIRAVRASRLLHRALI